MIAVALLLVLLNGTDCTATSKEFTAQPHWRITCKCAKSGPQPDVTVYIDPAAGSDNIQVIHMTGNGEQSAYYRDGGRFKVTVNGWDASWNLTVEDSNNAPTH